MGIIIIVLLLSVTGKIYSIPMSGDWKVPTDFGEFIFTVNSECTNITKLVLTFSDWTCGGVKQSGGVTFNVSPGWSISNNQFTINSSVDPSGHIKVTINGTFYEPGDNASGTWSFDVYGTICSGSWGPTTASIEAIKGKVPERFLISQNYPNPFNANTTIRFDIPKSTHVSVKIYNALGSEVETLVDKSLPPGQYKTTWNAAGFASGVYVYRIQAGDFVETKKLILLK